GGIPKAIPLNSVDFSIDFNLLREAIGAKTKAIIVNTPHNPCGTVISEGDRETLYELIKDTDVVIIADEVYEQLVYTGYTHHSFLAYEALRARTFAIYSFGKVYNNTGWKVGYCIAPPAFTSAFRKIHQYLAFTTNSVAQYALAVYLANHTPAIPLVATMQTARDYFYNAMQATPFKLLPIAAGSYFQLACYEGLSNLGDFEFASLLTSKIGVATIPVSAFYADKTDNKLLRFCFAKSKATLLKATELLQNIDVLV
ncbi:MAG: aminotransferase class I/II-fold pyridoxal phosphate-dependent enzyme, partial [Chitinophagia bacterium]|nr:aminotransferase class I/II-fold pyridoxal phosphate-dependent enzyme [Chitinophagia bacterium]